jgi:hypothetical protein
MAVECSYLGDTGDILSVTDRAEFVPQPETTQQSEEVVVSDASLKIKRFERRVMWRNRWLSLQDNLSIALLVGGIISAAVIFYAKIRPVSAPSWLVIVALFGLVLAAVSVRWYLTRATERDTAFRIDSSLDMEDRLTTARSIIERGGPEREIESVLLDDVAERLSQVKESSIVPYKFAFRHALSFIGLIAIIVAVLIPQKALPGGEELIAEHKDVQAAGEQLEQVAQEVIRELPPEVETAKLATEQAELGRALRRSSDTRAEALKKISELEGRIRQRHDFLASTRADEIVSLAEKRLRDALSPGPKNREDKNNKIQADANESDSAESDSSQQGADSKQAKAGETSKETQPDGSKKSDNAKPAQSTAENGSDKSASQSDAQKQSPQSNSATVNSNQSRPDNQGATSGNPSNNQSNQSGKEGQQSEGDRNSSPQNNQAQNASVDIPATDSKKGDGQSGQANDDTAPQQNESGKPEQEPAKQNGLSGMMAEQAAKAMPTLSEQLLKNAQQLRLDQIKPEDIRRLRESAEQLARDLAPIAQSEEFRKMVEQLARQVDAEQLERMAQELMKQEDLRRELFAAARLLAENRQIKEIASGLAPQDKDGNLRGQERDQSPGRGGQNGGRAGGSGQGNQSNKQVLALSANQPLAPKRDARLSGNMQKRQGGEYLFLQSTPGVGAVRAPYSTAYPRYRREAERSVERSQVPAHLRSLVRNYFDVINPDAGKQQ